jgi:hypothetical protein
VGGVSRRLFEGLHNHLLDVVVADRAGGSGSGFVVETFEALLEEPITPFAHRLAVE